MSFRWQRQCDKKPEKRDAFLVSIRFSLFFQFTTSSTPVPPFSQLSRHIHRTMSLFCRIEFAIFHEIVTDRAELWGKMSTLGTKALHIARTDHWQQHSVISYIYIYIFPKYMSSAMCKRCVLEKKNVTSFVRDRDNKRGISDCGGLLTAKGIEYALFRCVTIS